jgi:hypothetical protein
MRARLLLALSGLVLVAGCSADKSGQAAGGLVLTGVYAEQAGDAGGTDPLYTEGNVFRFSGAGYSLHLSPCAADADAASGAGDDAGPDESPDPEGDPACTSYGTYALSPDGTTLSLTDSVTGATTALPFDALATGAEVAVEGGTEPTALRALDNPPLVNPGGSLLTGAIVSLFGTGGKVYKAVPCSGESSKVGADTGAMIRTATATSFTCIQSQVTFPSFNVPNGPSGSYCTAFSASGCTSANYYGRRGVPFIYFTFVTAGRAECGFEYQPGAPASGGQGNPRWSPYIRDTAGAYVYGAGDQRPGTTATVWCGIEPSGLVEMKINGSLVTAASGSGAFASKLSFQGQAVHAFRVTGLAWPETAPSKVASAKANGTYFPAYTCQPMNQLGPTTYANTVVCPGSSATPSVPYVTSAGGNARWSGGNDGYTLSPSSEVSETQSGTTDTDVIFPGGG